MERSEGGRGRLTQFNPFSSRTPPFLDHCFPTPFSCERGGAKLGLESDFSSEDGAVKAHRVGVGAAHRLKSAGVDIDKLPPDLG